MQIPDLDQRGLRNFGLTFGIIIATLLGLLLPWLFNYGFPWWPWVVGFLFALWAVLAPKSLKPFYRIWMRFGLLLNAVMSRIILAIVFYLVVLPTGVILKLRGRDPMRRKLDNEIRSYRITSRQSPSNHMQKPF